MYPFVVFKCAVYVRPGDIFIANRGRPPSGCNAVGGCEAVGAMAKHCENVKSVSSTPHWRWMEENFSIINLKY